MRETLKHPRNIAKDPNNGYAYYYANFQSISMSAQYVTAQYVTLQMFFHIQVLVIYFFATPPIKLKLG
jgi:hypothetical protein